MAQVKYQFMPPLAPEEYAELEASIKQHGVMVPVLVDPDSDSVIDGHHRKKIAESLGIDYPVEYADEKTETEKEALAYTLNLARRNLTIDVRRELVGKLIQEGKTQTEIAQTLGVSQPTVASDVANISPDNRPQTRTNSRGENRPTTYKPREKKSEPKDDKPAAPRKPRTDVVATVNTVLQRAQDAMFATRDLEPHHFNNRPDEAAIWAANLEQSLEALTEFYTLLKEKSAR